MTNREKGAIDPFTITTAILSLAVVGLGIAFTWAFMQRNDYKNDYQVKVDAEVAKARENQSTEDATKFAEEEKKPNRKFETRPELGSVKFDYPKTWSVYVDKDAATQYSAYFFPLKVPPINNKTVYALRLNIENRAYDVVLKSYDGKLKKGDLSSEPITIGKTADFVGYEGVRINGLFDEGITGSLVIFKIRGNTLTLRTDAQDYMQDFNDIILATLTFEP